MSAPNPGWNRPSSPAALTPTGDTVVRVIAGVIGVPAGLLALLGWVVVLSSLTSSDPHSDPHGYGLLFGVVFGIPAGLIAVAALPFTLPRHRWRRAVKIGAAVFCAAIAVVVVAGQIAG